MLSREGRRSALSWRRAVFLLDSGIQASVSLPSFHSLGPFSTFRLSSPSILSGHGVLQGLEVSEPWASALPGSACRGDRNKRGEESLKVASHREAAPIGRESALAGGHGTSPGHET